MPAQGSAFCERIGRDCPTREICLIARDDWTEAATHTESLNTSSFSTIGRAISRVLPFIPTYEKVSVQPALRMKERYEELLREPCEDSCVAERALDF